MTRSPLLLAVAAALPLAAQQDTTKKPYEPLPLFTDSKVVEITVSGPMSKIRRERTGDAEYYPGTVSYAADTGTVTVPVRLRARGIWRRKNCEMPPLLLNFAKDSVKGTLFRRVDRARLTFPCRYNSEYEQYVLQEYMLYRVHRLITPYSFDVRLAKVTYVDSERPDNKIGPHWAFLQEQDDMFAERIGALLVEQQGAGPGDLHPTENALFGVWQYFIATADYSVRALHNVVMVLKDAQYVPVSRDFDFGGAVNARYANPPPGLGIRRVTDRIMRGYCEPAEEYERAFQVFRDKKDAIYALYSDELAAGLKPDVVKRTLAYFDDFYAIINDKRRADRNIVQACLK